MKQLDMTIQNPAGLHARPAKVFVNIAKKYQSDIRVRYGEKEANAKSLISMLTLGVENGCQIEIEISGRDEVDASREIETAILNGLGEKHINEGENENVHPENFPIDSGSADRIVEVNPDGHITGIAGAPGIAIGPIYRVNESKTLETQPFTNETQEISQLQNAIAIAKDQLIDLSEDMLSQGIPDEAAIFDVHMEILGDDELKQEILKKINLGQCAPLAWQAVIEDHADAMASLNDPLLAARAADFRDVGFRVQRIMAGEAGEKMQYLPDHPVVVIAPDLLPSDTASLDKEKVLGICTAFGGPTAHTAIIARALGIPAVVSAGEAVLSLSDSTEVILNGSTGEIIPNPTEAEIAFAEKIRQDEIAFSLLAKKEAAEPAITLDGHKVTIAANIGGVSDAEKAAKSGAEAVGLLRTEFLFLGRENPPSEEEQVEVYREIAHAMGERPIVVRTMDIGGDKPLPYIPMADEANPFLGERGIRLCLNKPDLLREQVRAIFKAETRDSFRIMFPMVSDLAEWHAVQKIVHSVETELGVSSVETGIMVEVPSAALIADAFAKYVDFFSIGTNDLTQYTLAMDRLHPQLAGKSDGLHPAVLRLIDMTVRAAHQNGKWVGVCGELGADPQAVPILVGLGVDELSVNVPAIPAVKTQVRRLNFVTAQSLAGSALKCETADEVRRL